MGRCHPSPLARMNRACGGALPMERPRVEARHCDPPARAEKWHVKSPLGAGARLVLTAHPNIQGMYGILPPKDGAVTGRA